MREPLKPGDRVKVVPEADGKIYHAKGDCCFFPHLVEGMQGIVTGFIHSGLLVRLSSDDIMSFKASSLERVNKEEHVRRVCINCKHGHEKGSCNGSIFIDGFYCEHKQKWIQMFKKACKNFTPKGATNA